MREGRLYSPLSLRISISPIHTCGARVVSADNGALGICKSLVSTETRGPFCVIPSLAFVLFVSVSERTGGGSRPRSKTPCRLLT